ncbi:hypothetical protein [Rhodococcus sp. AG1013]|uniref:hypothetical protein n=1 Tax=unclassified Rhodococcus (in: high G+C Gram-positive bacteria) TaxID=192944 RepID=UPI000E0BDA8E|nr:hypothetical protein [Rhodococcus sp. AG1013]RDI35649.1 hypothetical protein DEU38_101126 [Rhodococcus sp. AG1013]
MPRTQEYSDRYADAMTALAAATHRPTSVVNIGGEYAIRVDFAFSMYVLATNSEHGLNNDPDAQDIWLVRFFEEQAGGDVALVEARHEWLVDAFDLVIEELVRTGKWVTSDAMLHEIAPRPDAENGSGA